MDIEANARSEVTDAIAENFNFWEEVEVDAIGKKLRVDIVAIPKAAEFSQFAIGFEVKAPSYAMNFQKWASVFKQAADYVGSKTTDGRVPPTRLRAVFVYPSPPYVPFPSQIELLKIKDETWFRKEQLQHYAGVMHLAELFRVGHASFQLNAAMSNFQLSMGPNPIWNQKFGWFRQGKNLLLSTRIGSQTKKSGL